MSNHPDLNAEVSGCDPRLSFACPKRWASLQETDDPLTRYCRVCSQPVRFFPDAEAAKERGAGSRAAVPCVALPDESGGTILGGINLSLAELEVELEVELDVSDAAEPVSDIADAAMALISALESQDPDAATGGLIFDDD